MSSYLKNIWKNIKVFLKYFLQYNLVCFSTLMLKKFFFFIMHTFHFCVYTNKLNTNIYITAIRHKLSKNFISFGFCRNKVNQLFKTRDFKKVCNKQFSKQKNTGSKKLFEVYSAKSSTSLYCSKDMFHVLSFC